jgi:hypothetical protein
MKLAFVALGMIIASTAISKDLMFAWDPSTHNAPVNCPGSGYPSNKIFYELKTSVNSTNNQVFFTDPGKTELTAQINFVPDDKMNVKIRAIAGNDFICSKVQTDNSCIEISKTDNVDCDKSNWVTFNSLPSIDDTIVFPKTPEINVSINTISHIDFAIASMGSTSGSIDYYGNTYSLNFQGNGDWWYNSDTGGVFAWVLSDKNDYEITTKITNFDRNNSVEWTRAGIGIRQSLNLNSKNAAIFLTKEHGIYFQSRRTTGGTTSGIEVSNIVEPVWLKLTKTGTTFTGSYSLNGIDWIQVGTRSITMSSPFYVGLVGNSDATDNSINVFLSEIKGF